VDDRQAALRAARRLIERYGLGARTRALLNAAAVRRAGDPEGAARWEKIGEAADELHRAAQEEAGKAV